MMPPSSAANDELPGLQIGRRVRSLRKSLRLSRKQLSQRSGVSERYLGQLENGHANVSVGVLNRIAGELGVTLSAVVSGQSNAAMNGPIATLVATLTPKEQEEAFKLLKRTFEDRPVQKKGIALIGLRGAGKSTLGEALAEVSGYQFLRMTNLIAEAAGMRLVELMELGGQNAYRRMELDVLKKIISAPGMAVLETSGGIVNSTQAYELLCQHFRTVWITATPEEHMQRVIDQNDLRPMAGRASAMADLKALLADRLGAYQKADYVLDTSSRTLRECLGELVDISAGVLFVNQDKPDL